MPPICANGASTVRIGRPWDTDMTSVISSCLGMAAVGVRSPSHRKIPRISGEATAIRRDAAVDDLMETDGGMKIRMNHAEGKAA